MNAAEKRVLDAFREVPGYRTIDPGFLANLAVVAVHAMEAPPTGLDSAAQQFDWRTAAHCMHCGGAAVELPTGGREFACSPVCRRRRT